MTHEIVFAPEAQLDLLDLYDMVAEGSSGERAVAYVERVQAACLRLAVFPERGNQRNDVRPGLRVIGFERRVAIAFHVGAGRVTIDRILYGGRDMGTLFSET